MKNIQTRKNWTATIDEKKANEKETKNNEQDGTNKKKWTITDE